MVGAFRALRSVTHRHLFTQRCLFWKSAILIHMFIILYMVGCAAAISTGSFEVELTTKADLDNPIFRTAEDKWLYENHVEYTGGGFVITNETLEMIDEYNKNKDEASRLFTKDFERIEQDPIFRTAEDKWLYENHVEYTGGGFLITNETLEMIDEYNKNKDEASRLFTKDFERIEQDPIFLSADDKWLYENHVEYTGDGFVITNETLEMIDEYNKNKDEASRLFTKVDDRRGGCRGLAWIGYLFSLFVRNCTCVSLDCDHFCLA